MNLIWDYHTHTTFSHGKGSILDNVEVARKKGLEEIAISDHGPGHITYGVKRENFKIMREEINRINKEFDDIKVLLSVEANIINPSGNLDIKKEEFSDFDFVIAGYHYGILGENAFNASYIHLGNLIATKFGTSGKIMASKNTEIITKAIYENDILILTHPGDKCPVYIEEIFKACSENNTLLEINNGHGQLNEKNLRIAENYDVKFAISSDAHTPSKVGAFSRAFEILKSAGTDLGKVVNLKF